MKKIVLFICLFLSYFLTMSQKPLSYILKNEINFYGEHHLFVSKLHPGDTIKIFEIIQDNFGILYEKHRGFVKISDFDNDSRNQILWYINKDSNINKLGVDLPYKLIEKSSSYYFKKASTNLTIGFSLVALDCLYSTYSTKIFPVKLSNNYNDSNEGIRKSIGIGIGVIAFYNLINGSIQIGNAAYYLDKEKKVSITPSNTGLGLNINF